MRFGWITLALVAGAALAAQAPPRESGAALPDLLRQAGEYVRHFEQAFAVMIGDERYEQLVRESAPAIADRVMSSLCWRGGGVA